MKRMSAALLVFVAAAPSIGVARAGDTARDGLARCAAVTDALQRLECFDRLTRALGLGSGSRPPAPGSAAPASGAAPELPAAGPTAAANPAAAPRSETRRSGQWSVRVERDDKGRIHVATVSAAAVDAAGVIGDVPTLSIRCLDSETAVYVDWENQVGNDRVPVTYSVDGGGNRRMNWQVSTRGTRTYYPGKAAAFAGTLRAARELDIRVNPYGGHQISARFDLAGLAEASRPLGGACRW